MPLKPMIVVALLLHVYIGWRLGASMTDVPWALALLLIMLVISAVAIPLGLPVRRSDRKQPEADRRSWIGMFFMGLFSTLFVLTLARDMALLVGAAVLLALSPSAFSLEAAIEVSGRAVPLLALGVTLWGLWNARRTARVLTVEVPIVGLPAALEGFSIAQISDVHVGPTIKRGYVQAIVRTVNSLNADMVAVTGDVVDGTVRELADDIAPLAELQSVHGSFFVTGNHEYYSGAQAWVNELRRLGLTVLMNEHRVLSHAGESVVVAGVTDYSAGRFDPSQRSDPQAAIARAPANAFKLLLAHQPRSAVAAAEAGFDLQLSGHTHGGQFWPWNLFVPFQQPYTAGLHRLRDLWVYTSRGTGYWGPPKRFGAPSEITQLRLVRA